MVTVLKSQEEVVKDERRAARADAVALTKSIGWGLLGVVGVVLAIFFFQWVVGVLIVAVVALALFNFVWWGLSSSYARWHRHHGRR
jgi:Flp pilus assembly protein TadB